MEVRMFQPMPCLTGAEDVYSFSTALSALAVAGQWQLAVGLVEGMPQACSPKMRTTPIKWDETRCFCSCFLFAALDIRDASRRVLPAPREQDREDLLGPKLEPSWDQVGAKRVRVGPKSGALLADVDPKLNRCCGHVGSKRCIWTMVGPSAKCANYHSPVPCTFWRGSLSWKCPPSWSCTSWTDLFASLAAKLPRFSTFGAGGFQMARREESNKLIFPCALIKFLLLLVTYSILDLWFPISMPRGGGATQRRDQRCRTQRLGRWCTVAADAADAADHAGGGILDGETTGFCLIFIGFSIRSVICNPLDLAKKSRWLRGDLGWCIQPIETLHKR